MPPLMTHRPRKHFGQNFLQDKAIIAQIVRAIAPQPDQCLVEIGPGQGALTLPIVPLVQRVIAVELDQDLIIGLRASVADLGTGDFHLVAADALEVDFNSLPLSKIPFRLYGNLPYNISTPLLFHALEYVDKVSDMTFMLQKEVVDRMVASPGNKTYGRLSVMVQYFCQAETVFEVPPESFYPVPKVMSAVVNMVPYAEQPHVAIDVAHFKQVVREAFSHRRKTLGNAIKNLLQDVVLADLGFDAKLRPEQLSVGDYVALSNAILNAK